VKVLEARRSLRVAATAVACAVAAIAASQGALGADPGALAPAGAPTSSTTSTSTSTTTTTAPATPSTTMAPGTTTTTTTALPNAVPSAPMSDAGPNRVAGPPDVNASLPADSLSAAQTELDILHAQLQSLEAEDQDLAQALVVDRQHLASAQQDLDVLTARRRRRAEGLYRDLSSGASLNDLLFLSSAPPEAASTRHIVLGTAADRDERRRLRALERERRGLESRLAGEDQRRGELAIEVGDTNTQITSVLDKLTAAAATPTPAGAQVPAEPATDPVARAARAADVALTLATEAQQGAAVATSSAATSAADPALTAAASAAEVAAAEAQLGLTDKRAALADLLGGSLRADAAAFDAIWAATPVPALHATLFALSQVGKPYVYATAGPATYDCSGLTKRAWAESGVRLPHFSGAQLHTGVPVAPAQLRPGDLLTYGPDGSEHVVLSIGNNWVVSAKGRRFGVVIAPVNVDPLRGFAGASRPLS
jgi:cell wall-associated NlpC family hydrolase